VDDKLSISLQSNHLSTLNMEDSLRCALYSTQLSIKTLSETLEILTSSGTSVLLHFYSLCPSKATSKIFKNMSRLLSTLPQSENIPWKTVIVYAWGLDRKKFRTLSLTNVQSLLRATSHNFLDPTLLPRSSAFTKYTHTHTHTHTYIHIYIYYWWQEIKRTMTVK
jgi:hypothetical protein